MSVFKMKTQFNLLVRIINLGIFFGLSITQCFQVDQKVSAAFERRKNWFSTYLQENTAFFPSLVSLAQNDAFVNAYVAETQRVVDGLTRPVWGHFNKTLCVLIQERAAKGENVVEEESVTAAVEFLWGKYEGISASPIPFSDRSFQSRIHPFIKKINNDGSLKDLKIFFEQKPLFEYLTLGYCTHRFDQELKANRPNTTDLGKVQIDCLKQLQEKVRLGEDICSSVAVDEVVLPRLSRLKDLIFVFDKYLHKDARRILLMKKMITKEAAYKSLYDYLSQDDFSLTVFLARVYHKSERSIKKIGSNGHLLKNFYSTCLVQLQEKFDALDNKEAILHEDIIGAVMDQVELTINELVKVDGAAADQADEPAVLDESINSAHKEKSVPLSVYGRKLKAKYSEAFPAQEDSVIKVIVKALEPYKDLMASPRTMGVFHKECMAALELKVNSGVSLASESLVEGIVKEVFEKLQQEKLQLSDGAPKNKKACLSSGGQEDADCSLQ